MLLVAAFLDLRLLRLFGAALFWRQPELAVAEPVEPRLALVAARVDALGGVSEAVTETEKIG